MAARVVVLDGVRRYECAICRKTFSKSYNLRAHQRKHTGERPFKCPFPGCNRDFSWKSSLTSHKQTHTRSANRQPSQGGGFSYGVATEGSQPSILQNLHFRSLSPAQQAQILLGMQNVRTMRGQQEHQQQQMQVPGLEINRGQDHKVDVQHQTMQFPGGMEEFRAAQGLPPDQQGWQGAQAQFSQQNAQMMQWQQQGQQAQHVREQMQPQPMFSVPAQIGPQTSGANLPTTGFIRTDVQTQIRNGSGNTHTSENNMQQSRQPVHQLHKDMKAKTNEEKEKQWNSFSIDGGGRPSLAQEERWPGLGSGTKPKGEVQFTLPSPFPTSYDQMEQSVDELASGAQSGEMDIERAGYSIPATSNAPSMVKLEGSLFPSLSPAPHQVAKHTSSEMENNTVVPKEPPREIDLGDCFTDRDELGTGRPLSLSGAFTPGVKYSPFPVSTPFSLVRGNTPLCRLPGGTLAAFSGPVLSPMQSPGFRPQTPIGPNFWPQSPFPLLAKNPSQSKLMSRQNDTPRDG